MIELNSTIVKDFLEFKIDLEELVRQGLQLNNPRKEFSKEDVDKNVDLFISSAIKKQRLQQNLWIEGIPL